MSSARIRAPRGTLALHAATQSRKLSVEIALADYNEWIEEQGDLNAAAPANEAPSRSFSSARTSASSPAMQFESLSLEDWLAEGRWRAIHVIPKARMALLVESKRGYSGLATDEHLDCFDEHVQPHSLPASRLGRETR